MSAVRHGSARAASAIASNSLGPVVAAARQHRDVAVLDAAQHAIAVELRLEQPARRLRAAASPASRAVATACAGSAPRRAPSTSLGSGAAARRLRRVRARRHVRGRAAGVASWRFSSSQFSLPDLRLPRSAMRTSVKRPLSRRRRARNRACRPSAPRRCRRAACQWPRSQITTLPAPYWPSGISPSKPP